MKARYFFYPFLSLFSVAMFASCSLSVPKEGDIIEDSAFRSVDLRIIEKTKGTVMSLGDLMESYEIIRLDNRDEALIKTYPYGVYVTDNYILLRPADVVSPVKLFTRKGRYVADIGGVGQGPGEYLYLFSWLVDEKENRIYLGPGRTDKVLVYDLKGNYLPDEVIRFGEIVHKSQIWVDYDKKNVVVVTLPFSANVNSNFAISKNVCWVQNREGDIVHRIPVNHYGLIGDYSNALVARRNVDAISFSISEVPMLRTRPDTLYHYDAVKNIITPCFTIDHVVSENQSVCTVLYETSRSYWAQVTLYPNNLSSSVSSVRLPAFNVCVSKKDGNVRRIDRFTDPLLGLSHLFLMMNNGYICISYDPLELMDALDKVLTQTDLEPDVRKRATDLRNSLHENDNDILIIGKLKQ
ncbi:6-bladed beta-propeller [Bacteroides fragilis]|uniref:6-bladed beta-propeller n=1 Tax=Bacteroides fragilis TaxID=817 RepID=A0AAP8ZS21_BACFG|nr:MULTISPECIES: 6-bladed beta-propeller [Bacteroides]MCE8648214.1 6-bladed beta-propeller [Bacteroides fragilis]MCM0350191.1 6-bladed beta-propeller [Bacteroides fragilis]MCM0369822.1 6-bladed beta-propeller [Bacteroides fragilis]MCS2534752.1 6-bladed beta-propeller [Bacteroides fragilis]MCS2594640.1 6-bladed beta-propeller [Bacteroides fragilis]